jgi:hypothetical protein
MVVEWEEDDGVNAEWIRCNPLSEWREEKLSPSSSSPQLAPLRVSLMGDEDRRIHPTTTASLYVTEQELRTALQQERAVTRFHLVEEQIEDI